MNVSTAHENPASSKAFLLAGTFVTLALVAFSNIATAQSVRQEVIDARQQSRIDTTYQLNPYLRSSALAVVVRKGTATLTGTVEENVDKELAEQIALGVDGVGTVDNQIEVRPDYVAPASGPERSYGEIIDDATITAVIKSKLAWSKYTDALSTNIETNRGDVTLLGEADTATARDLAGQLATNTRGVSSVHNKLVVTAPEASMADGARETMNEVGTDIADAWITTKVKSTFFYSSNVPGSDIAVKTTDGKVTLSGELGSGAQRALAVELAKNVRGVKQVDAASLISLGTAR